MLESIGVCGGYGRVEASIKAGRDVVGISRENKRWFGMVNGRAVLASNDLEKLLPVAVAVASALGRRNGAKGIKCSSKSKVGQLQEVDRFIREHKDLFDKFMLDTESKPDESQENTPKEASLPGCLDGFRSWLSDIGKNLDGVKHTANILLKTEPAKDMWGGKKVAAVIAGIRAGMEKLSEHTESIERRLEIMDDTARYLRAAFGTPAAESRVKVAAGSIIANFAELKAYMSDLAQVLHRLHGIDAVFKECTGYPATWFLDSTILMDFMFEYGTLMTNLAGAARAEVSAVEPLMVWRIGTEHKGVL